MKRFKYAAPAVSVAALLSGSAAYAQVTAQEVWDDWKSSMTMYGDGEITIGSEEAADGTITVSNIAINVVSPESTVTGNIPSLVMEEQGDGTVLVTMSEENPFSLTFPNEDGTTGTVNFALRQTDLAMTVSGTADAMTYDISATRYALELDGVNDGTQDIAAKGLLAINDMAGTYTVSTADMRTVDYDVSATSIDLLADVSDPEMGGSFNLSGSIADLASTASMVMPLPENTTPETVLMDGMAMEGGYTFGQSDYTFAVTDPSTGDTNGTATIASGSLDFVLSAESFGYSSAASNIAVTATSAMMPFPVTISMSEYGLDLLMPMSKTEEPVDYAVGVNLSELSVNDEIWAMLDPGAVLPRDPATIVLDVTGTAKLLFDLIDPSQTAAMEAAPAPGEIHSLNLNDLDVSFGGAQVTGKGAFTFDNTDMTTFPGMPRPTGDVTLNINGVNGLIDNLVSMGLLPEEQVMGARMMMGMFTVPVGDDMLTTKIEVTPEGGLVANGQPLN